ncbi:MAG: AAA family ATPase, partial [Myxococcota bacterium]
QLPFEGTSPREVVLMHLSRQPPPLRQIAPDRNVPEALLEIVHKALKKAPEERFQSSNAFAVALREVGAMSIPARSSLTPERLVDCAACGARVPVSQKFCGECGARMVEIEPSPISAARVADTLPPPPPPDPADKRLSFVGRDEELGTLFELRDRALKTWTTCAVVGHSGAGKSRLLTEFLNHAGGFGDVVVLTGPDPWWSGEGYRALRDIVGRLANLPPGGGGPEDWEEASGEATAGLKAIFGIVETGPTSTSRISWSEASPEESRVQSTERMTVEKALTWALHQAHGDAPEAAVIIAIDDVESVDGASLNALGSLIANPPDVPALILTSHRPTFLPNWHADERLVVGGLPTPLAASLLRGDTGHSPPPIASADERRVAPLYVDQLRRFNDEGGHDPPSKLADLVALRIERTPVESRRVLQAIAVVGDNTAFEQLKQILEDEVSDIASHLADLDDAGFIEVVDDRIRTAHPLVREIVVAGTPAAVRETLHYRARRADDPVTPMPLEAQADHAYRARESFEALMLLERVADRAKEREDTISEVRALRMATELARLEMSRDTLDDPLAAVLMFSCKLGDALCTDGKPLDAEGVLLEALDLTGPASAERSRILASLARGARGIGRPDKAIERLEEAVAIAEKSEQSRLLNSLEELRSRWVQGL